MRSFASGRTGFSLLAAPAFALFSFCTIAGRASTGGCDGKQPRQHRFRDAMEMGGGRGWLSHQVAPAPRLVAQESGVDLLHVWHPQLRHQRSLQRLQGEVDVIMRDYCCRNAVEPPWAKQSATSPCGARSTRKREGGRPSKSAGSGQWELCPARRRGDSSGHSGSPCTTHTRTSRTANRRTAARRFSGKSWRKFVDTKQCWRRF